MAKFTKLNPLAVTLGAAFVASVLSVPVAQASTATYNPFAASDLGQGYQLAHNESGDKKAEGSCGANKKAEGSCGANKKSEGSCGASKDKKAEGSCGASKS